MSSIFCHIEGIGLDLIPCLYKTVFLSEENYSGKLMAQKQGHSLIEAVGAGLKEDNTVTKPDCFGKTPAQQVVHRAEGAVNAPVLLRSAAGLVSGDHSHLRSVHSLDLAVVIELVNTAVHKADRVSTAA